MATLCFHLHGPAAEAVAAALSALLTEGPHQPTVTPLPPVEGSVKSIDRNLVITGLILAVPGAILNAADLGDRIFKRGKAESVLACARKLEADNSNRVQIFMVMPGGDLKPLNELTPDKLLEIANAHPPR